MGNLRTDGESLLRGGALEGAERKSAVDHTANEKSKDSDAVLRVDGEADSLFDDGLELDDDTPPISGTDGSDNTRI